MKSVVPTQRSEDTVMWVGFYNALGWCSVPCGSFVNNRSLNYPFLSVPSDFCLDPDLER